MVTAPGEILFPHPEQRLSWTNFLVTSRSTGRLFSVLGSPLCFIVARLFSCHMWLEDPGEPQSTDT